VVGTGDVVVAHGAPSLETTMTADRFTESKGARPFVKWVGGKRQLVPELLEHLPTKFDQYFEPFVGGGALFFALANEPRHRFRAAFLRDMCEPLIRTYLAIRDDHEEVIRRLSRLKYDPEVFARMRAKDFPTTSLLHHTRHVDAAVWFLYLNKTCFNALWRVNKAGRFNTPFGRYTNPTICDASNLTLASNALRRRVNIRCADFAGIENETNKGDVVYFDPPYVPVAKTADFTQFTKGGFGLEDQTRLRDLALRLKKKKVRVILSNSNAPLVHELYARGFKIHEVSARRAINSKVERREAVTEVIIT
jgi:DNA adenine methylase